MPWLVSVIVDKSFLRVTYFLAAVTTEEPADLGFVGLLPRWLTMSRKPRCEAFADDGHTAFIEITERPRRGAAGDSAMNQLSRPLEKGPA